MIVPAECVLDGHHAVVADVLDLGGTRRDQQKRNRLLALLHQHLAGRGPQRLKLAASGIKSSAGHPSKMSIAASSSTRAPVSSRHTIRTAARHEPAPVARPIRARPATPARGPTRPRLWRCSAAASTPSLTAFASLTTERANRNGPTMDKGRSPLDLTRASTVRRRLPRRVGRINDARSPDICAASHEQPVRRGRVRTAVAPASFYVASGVTTGAEQRRAASRITPVQRAEVARRRLRPRQFHWTVGAHCRTAAWRWDSTSPSRC